MNKTISILFAMIFIVTIPLMPQTTQIAFQGFEGSGNDTWGLVAGSGKISTATGSSDYPANQRIRTGVKSWQISNVTDSLILETFDISNYDSIVVTIRLSSPATSNVQGTELSDSVNVFCAINGTDFSGLSDLTITGFGTNNARWGYDAVLTAQTNTGSHALFSSPQTGDSTNNYATLRINIPDGTASVALKIVAKNNNVAEFWCIDDIALTGVPAITGPTIYQPVSPQNFSTTVGVPDTNHVHVLYSSLISGLYAQISGSDASLFTVIPDSITASTPSPYVFKVIYLPVAVGSHTATLTFSSADAVSREVTLSGATAANEPSAQPTNLAFSNVTNTSFTISYTAAAGSPDGYIALRKTGSSPTGIPLDGTFYSAGNSVGDATVAYIGSNISFEQTGLNPGTTYFYKIYSYNGSGNSVNYLTVSPLSGSQQTTGTGTEIIFPGVYGDSLLARLVASYKTSTTLDYDGARDKMYGIIDNHNDSVTCVYSGYRIYIPYNDPNPRTWANAARPKINCEHTYPQNKFGYAKQPTSDLHHLYPTNEWPNNYRGNYPFDEIADSPSNYWWIGNDSLGQTGFIPSSNINLYSEEQRGVKFEPREDHKGNAARSVFYIYTMYKSVCDAADPNFFHIQKNVLLQWHYYDPVDAAEETRNNLIATYQQNKKNPFILDSTLVRRAYFPPVIGIDGEPNIGIYAFMLNQNYPNPFNPSTVISYQLAVSSEVSLKIYNLLGQEVRTLVKSRQSAGEYSVLWDGNDNKGLAVSSGIYIYRLTAGKSVQSKKMVLLR